MSYEIFFVSFSLKFENKFSSPEGNFSAAGHGTDHYKHSEYLLVIPQRERQEALQADL